MKTGLPLWLPMLAGLGVLVFLSLRSLEPAQVAAAAGAAGAEPRYALQGAQWLRTGADGAPQFIARATQMTWFDDQSAQLQQADVLALGGAGSPWRLSAPQGRIAAGSQELELSGEVLARGRWPDGAPLGFHTDTLRVDVEAERLHTADEIALEGPGRRMLATGLRADFEGRQLELLGNVRAHYNAAYALRDREPAVTPQASSDDAAPAP